MVLLVLCSSCIQSLGLTARERCATNGMLLDGTSSTSSSATAEGDTHGVGVAGGTVVATHVRDTTTVTVSNDTLSCRRPMFPEELCEVSSAEASLHERGEFETGSRNLIQFLGYVGLLIPGIIIHVMYVGERDDAERHANETYGRVYAQCLAAVHK